MSFSAAPTLPIYSATTLRIVPDEHQNSCELFCGKMVQKGTNETVATFVLTLIQEKMNRYCCGAGECKSIGILDGRVERAVDEGLLDLINRINEFVSSDAFVPHSFHQTCYTSSVPQGDDSEDSFEVVSSSSSVRYPSLSEYK